MFEKRQREQIVGWEEETRSDFSISLCSPLGRIGVAPSMELRSPRAGIVSFCRDTGRQEATRASGEMEASGN
jgi:hypothetical protein